MVRRVLISLSQDVLDAMDKIAKLASKTRSQLIRDSLRHYAALHHPDIVGEIPSEDENESKEK